MCRVNNMCVAGLYSKQYILRFTKSSSCEGQCILRGLICLRILVQHILAIQIVTQSIVGAMRFD